MTSMPTTVRTPHRTGTERNSRRGRSQEKKRARKVALKWCRQLPSEGAHRAFEMLLMGNKETPLGTVKMLIDKYKPTGAVRTYIDGLVNEFDIRTAAQAWCDQLPSKGDRRVFKMLLGKDKGVPLGVVIMLINKLQPSSEVGEYLDQLVDEIDDMQS